MHRPISLPDGGWQSSFYALWLYGSLALNAIASVRDPIPRVFLAADCAEWTDGRDQGAFVPIARTAHITKLIESFSILSASDSAQIHVFRIKTASGIGRFHRR
jgi:hypothetical protein